MLKGVFLLHSTALHCHVCLPYFATAISGHCLNSTACPIKVLKKPYFRAFGTVEATISINLTLKTTIRLTSELQAALLHSHEDIKVASLRIIAELACYLDSVPSVAEFQLDGDQGLLGGSTLKVSNSARFAASAISSTCFRCLIQIWVGFHGQS